LRLDAFDDDYLLLGFQRRDRFFFFFLLSLLVNDTQVHSTTRRFMLSLV
jgi:hypothetical protein